MTGFFCKNVHMKSIVKQPNEIAIGDMINSTRGQFTVAGVAEWCNNLVAFNYRDEIVLLTHDIEVFV